jgi:hypothetical protein
MGAKIHNGNWLDCKVCPHTVEELQQKREKRERPLPRRKQMAAATADVAVRRAIAYELGGTDGEPVSEQKFQVLQKYGVAAARIDRAVTKPKWMSEGTWRTKKAEFYQLTKGLVPKEQFKKVFRNPASNMGTAIQTGRYSSRVPQQGNYHGPQNSNSSRNSRPSQPRNSQNFRPNFAQAQTVARQS